MFPSEPQTFSTGSPSQLSGQAATDWAFLSWVMQYRIGTSKMCFLQLYKRRILEIGHTPSLGATQPAVLRLHSANVGIDHSVWGANGLGYPPTRFLAVSGGLAVLLVGAHHALSATSHVFLHFYNNVIFIVLLLDNIFCMCFQPTRRSAASWGRCSCRHCRQSHRWGHH